MLTDIVRAIGEEAAVSFVSRFGGTRISVPGTADACHPIAAAIGFENMAALIRFFGCGQLDVPRATRQIICANHNEIREKHASGHSANQLAREYGYTWRHIYRITSGTALKNENLELPI